MRILVVGSGGREHAIVHSLSLSPRKPEIYVGRGNAGTALLATNVTVSEHDVDGLLQFALRQKIDLTIVGPETPLVEGIVDRFRMSGLAIVGPTAAAARIEGSKSFSKDFMLRHGIPTAEHRTFGRAQASEAQDYLRQVGAPIVVKASGLAAGKGAVVCETLTTASDVVRSMLQDGLFGDAASEVVIEEFMEGEEASVFALCDAHSYKLLACAQDHKRLSEHDAGPNTGGMGAYAPAPLVTNSLLDEIRATIVEPTLTGMRDDGTPYTGILYVGIMVTTDGPKVVEYNCRLGDPEAQVVLPLIDADIAALFEATANDQLSDFAITVRQRSAGVVILASRGYPGAYDKGFEIGGLRDEDNRPDTLIFHAGTIASPDGEIHTHGGRVLGVAGLGESLREALDRAYGRIEAIHFDGMQFRKDIGHRGLARLEKGATAGVS